MKIQYKWLKYLADNFCQDSEFRFTVEISSVDNGLLVLLSTIFFPMDTISKNFATFFQRWWRHFITCANGFTFLMTSHLMLKLMFVCFF